MSPDRRRLALLVGVVAVMGHEGALAIGYGPGAHLSASLRATEHGAGWLLTFVTIGLAAAAAVLVASWRIRRLRRVLMRAGVPMPRSGGRWSAVLPTAHRIFAASLLVFLLQENAEHALLHGHLPGLETLLVGQYVATVPTFALLSVLAALVGVALTGRVAELRRAVAALSGMPQRAPATTVRPRLLLADRRSEVQRASTFGGRRAPPALLVA